MKFEEIVILAQFQSYVKLHVARTSVTKLLNIMLRRLSKDNRPAGHS